MSVADALAHGPTDDLVSVSGALFVAPDGTVRLCDAIAESFPPQCGGASIEVSGLDLSSRGGPPGGERRALGRVRRLSGPSRRARTGRPVARGHPGWSAIIERHDAHEEARVEARDGLVGPRIGREPVGVRPRAGVDRPHPDRARVRPLHRERVPPVEATEDVHRHQPRDRGAAVEGRPRVEGGRRSRGRHGEGGASVELVEAAGPRAGEVPLPDRAHHAGAIAGVRRRREHELRQADQGEPRRRRAACRGALLLLRGLGRQARIRLPEPRAALDRRRRPGHPVELPAADAGVEDRAGAGGGEHGRAEAGEHDPADRLPLRGRRAPGRPAAWRREHHHRPGRDRDGARPPSRRREGRVHRLDGGRQDDRAARSRGRGRR